MTTKYNPRNTLQSTNRKHWNIGTKTVIVFEKDSIAYKGGSSVCPMIDI